MQPAAAFETIALDDVIINDRIRGDLGDIDGMCTSIKEFGLIQPLVMIREVDYSVEDRLNEFAEPIRFLPRLVAGGRRYNALKRLGVKTLVHGKHFIWREEVQPQGENEISLKMQGIELEENLRRKDLTWQEQVLGKQRLLEVMQRIYGPPQSGRLPRDQRQGRTNLEVHQGFGVNKLAAMLNESPATVSRDLKIAQVAKEAPTILQQSSKGSAERLLSTVTKVHTMIKDAATVQQSNSSGEWILYEGDFKANIDKIPEESVDFVYTDLPFGVDLSQMSKHDTGTVGYHDDRDVLLGDLVHVATESYRILKNDRFAVFWFGFNYYGELLSALESAGFTVNKVPFVWYKNTRSTENPNARYGNAYDPAIVAMKGSPMFIRPGMQNYLAQPAVQGKLQIAQQPVELVERFLLDMTLPGATVVDFCAGSGTTGVAAVKAKRRVIMFEREAPAQVIIKARMAVLK